MTSSKKGLVSIGLPVFRGERFISAAIESILAQTYSDLEIIVSDNASDDETAAICQRYAAQDSRIIFQRNNTNIGVSANHNLVFKMASGEYFKWFAHDDRLDPDCIRQSVSALDAHPEAGLCYTATRVIDDAGREIVVRPIVLDGSDSARPSDRFAAILFGDRFLQSIFGLFRSSVLAKTRLFRGFHNSDRVLLSEVALLAPIVYVATPLFENRHYAGRYTSLSRPRDRAAWHHASGIRARCPMWCSYACYIQNVRRHAAGQAERLRCWRHLLRWWFADWNAALMSAELVSTVMPRLFDVAQSMKHRWVGDVGTTIGRPDR